MSDVAKRLLQNNPMRSDFTRIDSRTLSGAAAYPLNASVEIIPIARSSNLLSERGGQHFDRGRDAIEKLVVVVTHLSRRRRANKSTRSIEAILSGMESKFR